MASTESAPDLVSPLSVVCSYWKEFDLESSRSKLDEVALKVAEHQEESQQNRRKLADSTRDFKRSAADNVSKAVGALLKQYQEEIDRLTKRAKHGENAFLELYQKLYEAPDPAPALALAFETTSRATQLEAQVKKLSSELAEYKAESTQIKNQDLTIRKLEEKVRSLEAHNEEKDKELQEVKERAVAEADAARLAQMQEREEQLTAMLSEAQASLAAMQKLHQATQNQLFAIQSKTEEDQMGRQSELELATLELERAQERLLALEREKQSLVHKLSSEGASQASSNGSGQGASSHKIEETLRQELSAQRELATRLRMEVAALKRELDEREGVWEARVDGLRATLLATEQHAQAVEQELVMRPTVAQVEELRQQLRVLQAIGCGQLEEADEVNGSGDHSSAMGGKSSLESLLLSKNRHLEHELTMARLKVVDLQQELEQTSASVAELQTQVEEQRTLINRLEDDLLASRQEAEKPAGSAGSDNKLSGLISTQEDEEGSSMLRVLCSQRDRFRARCQELDEELTRTRAELAACKAEAAAAKADNMALVERLRYVHGYKQQQRGGGDVEMGAEVERRYARMYDEAHNPFKEFQGQQKERQKRQMNVPDRIMYMLSQAVLGTQTARLVAFLYLALMHLLVFTSITRMAHHSSGHLYDHHQKVLTLPHDMMSTLHHDTAAPH